MTALTLAMVYRAPLGSTYVSISTFTIKLGTWFELGTCFGLNAKFRIATMRGNAFSSVASLTTCSYVATTWSEIGKRW